jgi:succinoglycan biosynthesis transport protein ExoP
MSTIYPEKLTPHQASLDIKEFWRTLVQQRYLIFLSIAIALVISITISLLTKPIYRATTVIEIERQLANVTGIGALNADDPRDNRDFYQTQYELIKSRSIAKEVIEKLNLVQSMQPSGLKTNIKNLLGLKSELDYEGIFIEGITVEPVNTSRLVRISYDAGSPQQATLIVNTLADVFVQSNLKRSARTAESARTTLMQQLDKVKADLKIAQQELADFSNEHAYINGKPQEVFKKEKLLEQLDETLKEIQTLKSKKANAENESDTDDKTLDEIDSDLKVAVKKEQNLRVEISKLEDAINSNKNNNLQYDALQEAMKTSKVAYSNLQQKLKNINIAGGYSASHFIIVDKAVPPRKKHRPNILLNMIFGTLLGGLIGMAIAFLRDYMDDSFHFVDDTETATNLPVLAFTPEINSKQVDSNIGLVPCNNPRHPLAEAFRTLKTSLKFIPEANGDNIIFLTSAYANEGKSTAAANLACLYARSGKSVLLIDADLRNPTLHKIFSVEQHYGLEELLSGSTTPHEELFKITNTSNVSLITSGKPTDDPVNLIGNVRMERMLELAVTKYDHVIIDGSPVLGFADAQLLTDLSTATLLVIRAGQTPKKAIKNSIQRLRQANGQLIGILLTHVDMGKTNYQYGQYPHQLLSDQSSSNRRNKSRDKR